MVKMTQYINAKPAESRRTIHDKDATIEVWDLIRRGLLTRPTFWNNSEDKTQAMGLSVIALSDVGRLLIEMADLQQIASTHLDYIAKLTGETQSCFSNCSR